MVEISWSGSGEGSGWATAPGYSTAAFRSSRSSMRCSLPAPTRSLGRPIDPLRSPLPSSSPSTSLEQLQPDDANPMTPPPHPSASITINVSWVASSLNISTREPAPYAAAKSLNKKLFFEP